MRKLAVLLAALALPLAACGDDDDAGSGDDAGGTGGDPPVQLEGSVNNEGTAEAADGETLAMEVSDSSFGPTFVQSSPGATVTVVLTNGGELPHTFTLDSLGVDEELQPGDSTEVDVTLPESGGLLFYCRFHQGAGMQGAFFSQPGDAVRSGVRGGGTETTVSEGFDY